MQKQTIKKNMVWIKIIITNLFVLLLLTFSIDLVSYTFFSKSLKNFFPLYDRSSDFGSYQVRDYYQNHSERGFDIIANNTIVTDVLPREIGEYEIWGNNYGCFDKDWDTDISNKEDIIYLAGDSFTWGYVPFENKFSTILDQTLNSDVIACGVSHTGQRHQFSKFLEIYDQWKPKIVIVNFFQNDESDDFFFPSSSVSNGFVVSNYEYCIKNKTLDLNSIKSENILVYKKELSKLNKVFLAREENYLANNSKFVSLVKKYSLSANLLHTIWIYYASPIKIDTELINRLSYCPQLSSTGDLIDEILLYQEYNNSDLSQANRNAIMDWITHANNNNYRIIFSYIPRKNDEEKIIKYIEGKKNFILNQGAEVIDFTSFLEQLKIDKSIIYHKNDGHLSIIGNIYYAKYLGSYLKKNY